MRAARVVTQVVLGWAILSIVPAYPFPRGFVEAEMAAAAPVKMVDVAPVAAPQAPGREAAPQPPKEPPAPTGPPPTVNDALALAAADLFLYSATYGPYKARYQRYIWVTDGNYESAQAVMAALNYVSLASTPLVPEVIGRGRLMLVRADLTKYAPEYLDRKEWLALWEELRFEPRLNSLITKDTLKFTTGLDIPKVKKTVTKTRKSTDPKSGKTVDEEYREDVEYTPFDLGEDVIRVSGAESPYGWLEPSLYYYLAEVTHSDAPLVTHGYFVKRSMDTLQDDGPYKTIYGGLYYQLAKIPDTLDQLFEQLGIGNVKKGLTAQFIFDNVVRSDEKVSMFESKVTGKPRQVDILPTLSSRSTAGRGIIFITHDVQAKNIDIAKHAMANLKGFADDGREIIFTKANGMLGYSVNNGQGKRVDAVPQNIVTTDTTIPAPNRGDLRAARSCIDCHSVDDGWKLLKGDVNNITRKVDIFGDLRDKDRFDGNDRLVGQYSGEPEVQLMPTIRAHHANAMLRSTGPWKKDEKNGQVNAARVGGEAIAKVFADYEYKRIDAVQVLLDLGYEVKDPKLDPKALKKLAAEILQKSITAGIPNEEVGFRVSQLIDGGTISRFDYDLCFGVEIAPRFKGVRK